jgi:beta-glucosidase
MDTYEDRLADLSLDERARLAGGVDDWHTAALPDHGIPRLKVTDGPSGARGESYTTTTSASFPCGSALGATFDPAVVRAVAAAIADEVRTKGAHVLLGPTLNLHRHPLGGRNFESYGEDPLLVARLGVAFIDGLQSRGVGGCAKHLVANDAEIERLTISSEVDEATLREVYLLPFEAAVLEAGVWTVMGSYNRLNGAYACESQWLLTTVVDEEWGFDGLLMSDWFATHDTVRCALAGLHLEMPGPAKHFAGPLADAVRRGDVPEAQVTEMARRVLRTLDRVAATPDEPAERSEDDPERWQVARAAAAAATVLLRNEPNGDGLLPLDPASVRRIAVIGPNAADAVVQGGGSARVSPHRTVSPLEGIRARFDAAEVGFAPGSGRGNSLPVLDGRLVRSPDGAGLRITYRAAEGGDVLFQHLLARCMPVWSGRFSPLVDPVRFHATLDGTLVADRTGPHTFGVMAIGPCVVRLDGAVVVDTTGAPRSDSFFGFGTKEQRSTVDLVAGEPHALTVEYDFPRGDALGGLRLGVGAPLGDDPLGEAAALAAGADVAIVVVGNDEVGETEGSDRRTMALPGGQDELVRRVVAANPRTVVVVNAGAAVDLPWLDDVPAVLVTWFPGMAGGEALAAVLAGDTEPAGRLPFTVPVTLADAPCDIARADPPGQLRYTEGRSVGHRSYLDRGVVPRLWFGAGTGYTTFAWGPPGAPATWTPTGSPLTVRVPVTNTGARAGSDVVQVYARRPASGVARPVWVLAGFAKAHLAPGEHREVAVDIDPSALRHWDDGWHVEPGPLELRVARDAGDGGATVTVDVA